jgi:pimeloyl-ACP methyl ester carboxylesterase
MNIISHVRTPDQCFASLPGYPWQPCYTTILPSLHGLRLHYLDEGPSAAPVTWLCLHGNPAWSYLYRHMIPAFLAAGHRVVAPDMPGFGKSDKPVDVAQHTFTWHRSVLLELVESLDLRAVNLVVQDWGGLLGLTLPLAAPQRYRGLLIMNTALATAREPLPGGFQQWRAMCRGKPEFSIGKLFARGNPQLSAAESAAYDAPFPAPEFRAATRAFPDRVPEHPGDDGVEVSRRAEQFWLHEWSGRSMMAVGALDPVFTLEHMEKVRLGLRGCPAMRVVPEAGHFVQEHGQAIAEEAVQSLG